MNVDCNSVTNQNKVESKYITKESMDESLSDFQEVKKSHSGPKNTKTNTKKPRKPAKRPKGQKDIRSALKSKKNDLVTYTEEFDIVCKKSGIDVDTEELQLAIALSKSLQTEPFEDDNCQKELGGSQNRIKKIRTTLQEYGFKVPVAKLTTSKKTRKHKKSYQLLEKSDAEKQQIITDKYSQVLLTNVDKLNNFGYIEDAVTSLFHKSTNIPYKVIKNHDVFYNIDFIEQSTTDGCILRDWAKIPGRPASPEVPKKIEMNFSEIECSQEELDLVLSGLLTQTKRIVSLKETEKQNLHINPTKNGHNNENNKLSSANNIPSIIIESDNLSEDIATENQIINHETIYRSCSPDIFADEESVIEIIPMNTTAQEKISYIMDLTECVNNMPLKNGTFVNNCNFSSSQRSNQNLTKRKSDDFMEITECVASTSHLINAKVDLTHLPECKDFSSTHKNESALDLTQSSDSGDDLPEIYFSNKNNLDDTVPLNVNDYKGILSDSLNDSKAKEAHSDDVYDLTQDGALEMNQENYNDHKGPKYIENYEPEIISNVEQTILRNEKNMSSIQSSNSPNKSSLNTNNIIRNNIKTKDNGTVITEDSQHLNSLNSTYSNVYEQLYEKNASIEINSGLPDDNINLTKSSNGSVKTIIETNTISQVDEYALAEKRNLDILISTPDKFDNIKEADCNLSMGMGSNNDSPEPNIDLTQSSNSSSGKLDGVYENFSSFEHSLESSNDSDKTVILPLNDKCEKICNVLNDQNNVGNVSIAYDEVSIIYDANESYRGNNNTQTYLANEIEDGNKRDNLLKVEDPVFQIDDNSNDSNKTVLLPLENNKFRKTSKVYEAGNKDNVSIVYDEVILDNVDNYENIINNSSTSHTSNSKESHSDSHLSQDLEFRIVDNELNYSLKKSKLKKFDLGGISILDNVSNNPGICKTSNGQADDDVNNDICVFNSKDNANDVGMEKTPEKNMESKKGIVTPENNYIIKFDDVTPMPNYTIMATPEIKIELDKYGLKHFKRKRAIQLLTHIYNQTHPIIESMDDLPSPAKRLKLDVTPPGIRRKLLPSPKKALEMLEAEDIYKVTNETPELKEIYCADEDWVFQKREKSKVHSCRVPLHIAFHNYVSCRRRLRESILRYDPVDIDVIHKQLLAYGHRYDPKELLKFMDKKCITVKTADNKNNKY